MMTDVLLQKYRSFQRASHLRRIVADLVDGPSHSLETAARFVKPGAVREGRFDHWVLSN